ncbi:MAG TPA: hypothetical protein VEC96_08270, partial [Anaerolineae bacterium]|nr:hypothetical protein [Anaerolineae bacterium]
LIQKQGMEIAGPVGSFGWRYRRLPAAQTLMGEIQSEIAIAGENWPPLKFGLFNGSVDRFLIVKTAFDEWLKKVTWGW